MPHLLYYSHYAAVAAAAVAAAAVAAAAAAVAAAAVAAAAVHTLGRLPQFGLLEHDTAVCIAWQQYQWMEEAAITAP